MQDQARVVIIGGGITGCSIAYHLAKEGWTDVLLVEKGDLTSGSTAQAAGLVTQFNTSPTMMRFRKYSIDLYVELGIFEQVGSRFAGLGGTVLRLEEIAADEGFGRHRAAHAIAGAIARQAAALAGRARAEEAGHPRPRGAGDRNAA